METRPNTDHPNLGTRLDCWKEIASYLGRGERTVKRWEAERGLPIRRLPGGGRSSVYAFSAELDEWLNFTPVESLDPAAQATLTTPADSSVILPAMPASPAKSEARVEPETRIEPAIKPGLPAPAAPAGHRHTWRLAGAAAILLCLIGTALRLQAVRSLASRLWAGVAQHSPRSPAKQPVRATPSVSDAEKKIARDLYLKGRYEWNLRSPDSLGRALDAFTQAIVHDPEYAEAYVGLADTYDLLREYSNMPDQEAFSRSIAAARKAVQLDDSSAEGHRALAFAEMYGSWDFIDAEKEFRRAIALNPSDPVAHRWYANAIAITGRYPESLHEMNKAQELDPTSHSTLADKGILLFNAGRTREAIELLKQVEQSAPDFRSTHKYLMRIAFETEDYPLYLSEGRITAEQNHDPVLKNEMAQAQAGYTRSGRQGLLLALYSQQRKDYAAGKLWATILALTCTQLGRKQEAIQLLYEDYERHQEYMVTASLSDPILLTLKDEPGYQALLRKINYPSTFGKII
jgi:tetratricopeptide (TPR) repeat protein